MGAFRLALVGALAAAGCTTPPPKRPVAPTPGRDFVAGLPRCAADPDARPIDGVSREDFGARVVVRGTLVLGQWRCTLKQCSNPDGSDLPCCNGCGASWLVAESPEAAANGRGVGLVAPGSENELGIGAKDCVTAEISRSTPHPEVVVAGILRPPDGFHPLIRYDRLCVVRGAAAPPDHAQ